MGADIHLRVEHLVPSETVDVVAGEITVIQTAAELSWTPAEQIVSGDTALREDCKLFGWNYDEVRQEVENGNPEYDNYVGPVMRYQDAWYRGRDYDLFGWLNGVRNENAQFKDAGFPDDASEHVRDDYEAWGEDGHSPSHQTLTELETIDWEMLYAVGKYRNLHWFDLLDKLRILALTQHGGDTDQVRIVYWFDN